MNRKLLLFLPMAAGVAAWWGIGSSSSPQADPSPSSRAPAQSLVERAPAASLSASSSGEDSTDSLTIRSISQAEEEVSRLSACYEGGCAYPETDPASYEFAVGQDMRKTLLGLRDLAVREHKVDGEAALIARRQLENSDGYVQEAAISVLSTQPPNIDNLEAILAHVIGGFDENLVPAAMQELARYQGSDERNKIWQALSDAMLTGSPMVGRAITEHISVFLHEDEYRWLATLRQDLPEGSIIRANVDGLLASRGI